jgi:hypothetical protein
MATNVLKAGHQLVLTRAEATTRLETFGALRATDLPRARGGGRGDATSPPNDAIVEEVLSAP